MMYIRRERERAGVRSVYFFRPFHEHTILSCSAVQFIQFSCASHTDGSCLKATLVRQKLRRAVTNRRHSFVALLKFAFFFKFCSVFRSFGDSVCRSVVGSFVD